MNILGILFLAVLFFLTLTALLIWLVPIAFPAFGAVGFGQGMAMALLLMLFSAPWK